MTQASSSSSQGLSIGALSSATGVPVETLRTWERRYGYPSPGRTPGGHRVYSPDHVEQLRLVTTALERGYRPGNVLTIERDELTELLGYDENPRAFDDDLMEALPQELKPWLKAVKELDERLLDISLRTSWNRLGAINFLTSRISPFLTAVGHMWASEEISVLHEHFASERVRDFLSSQWRTMSDLAVSRNVFCTTLPGDGHSLGLHMAATTLAQAGVRIQYFGVNTPIDAVIDGVAQASPGALVVSISQAANPADTARDLRDLRAGIDESVPIIVGGSGAPPSQDGITRMTTFSDLHDWASLTLYENK